MTEILSEMFAVCFFLIPAEHKQYLHVLQRVLPSQSTFKIDIDVSSSSDAAALVLFTRSLPTRQRICTKDMSPNRLLDPDSKYAKMQPSHPDDRASTE